MNELEKNMKRIGTKNISEQAEDQQDKGIRGLNQDMTSMESLLKELIKINRLMLTELQKMPKRIGS
jgi:hypothetical protein